MSDASSSSGEEKGEEHVDRICGVDKKPLRPLALFMSLLVSMFMARLQAWGLEWHLLIYTIFGSIYFIAIGSAVYVKLSDPGVMSEDEYQKVQAGAMDLPGRAHTHGRRPILRYHQYCRWVTNCVGLRNHRAYVIMLIAFVVIALLDFCVDLVLVLPLLKSKFTVWEALFLLHLAYSAYFGWYSTPLARTHLGFVSRNELTEEWKRDKYSIVTVTDAERGERMLVSSLDTDEYNACFERFQYDPNLNPYDKGWVTNCLTFWFTSRRSLGDFWLPVFFAYSFTEAQFYKLPQKHIIVLVRDIMTKDEAARAWMFCSS